MTCGFCGKAILHGSHLGGQPGTYLNESGCHDGVWMDDDEYGEGWQPDVIYPPCPNNPACCKKCGGRGAIYRRNKTTGVIEMTDCPNKTCNSGWKGKPQWPIPGESEDEHAILDDGLKAPLSSESTTASKDVREKDS